mmetsp:Transcript_68859/g.128533  ORF Transcript_68859/g.128533 Transcript_68859/m.128533 type:complete len:222 (-) Transcript_68859:35-700(-)
MWRASRRCLLRCSHFGAVPPRPVYWTGAAAGGLLRACISAPSRGMSLSPITDSHVGSQHDEQHGRAVVQSLRIHGLQFAEWQIHEAHNLLREAEAGSVLSSPFRFHHVLLGDMYLELVYGDPYPGCGVIYFRSRVPQMKLEVSLEVGSSFSKTFISVGRSTQEEDLKAGLCLQVNLDAPGALEESGDLLVRCKLEKVHFIPPPLKEKIPKLDERASWPKRL